MLLTYSTYIPTLWGDLSNIKVNQAKILIHQLTSTHTVMACYGHLLVTTGFTGYFYITIYVYEIITLNGVTYDGTYNWYLLWAITADSNHPSWRLVIPIDLFSL